MTHPALSAGRVAVITGGASGIGLAAARRLAGIGMKIVLADLPGPSLDAAAKELGALAVPTDVSDADQVGALKDRAYAEFGEVSMLMNNAAIGLNPGKPWEKGPGWRSLLDINLFGVIHGTQAFVPAMLAAGGPGLIVNTGSKQGITTPPGNTAYNVSKAGVKSFTEALAHELRSEGSSLTAHLLIPGFTYTGMTARGEKPPAAWTPDQVVEFMLAAIERGDFYILCPDNDVPRSVDERRMRWAMDDIILNRPALSRWHPDFKAEFESFMKS